MRVFFNNHSDEIPRQRNSKKKVKKVFNTASKKKASAGGRRCALTKTEVLYRWDGAVAEEAFTRAFDKFCTDNTILEGQRKKRMMGFRSVFLKQRWDAATEDRQGEVLEFIRQEKARLKEEAKERYDWADRDEIDDAELARRNRAMDHAK